MAADKYYTAARHNPNYLEIVREFLEKNSALDIATLQSVEHKVQVSSDISHQYVEVIEASTFSNERVVFLLFTSLDTMGYYVADNFLEKELCYFVDRLRKADDDLFGDLSTDKFLEALQGSILACSFGMELFNTFSPSPYGWMTNTDDKRAVLDEMWHRANAHESYELLIPDPNDPEYLLPFYLLEFYSPSFEVY